MSSCLVVVFLWFCPVGDRMGGETTAGDLVYPPRRESKLHPTQAERDEGQVPPSEDKTSLFFFVSPLRMRHADNAAGGLGASHEFVHPTGNRQQSMQHTLHQATGCTSLRSNCLSRNLSQIEYRHQASGSTPSPVPLFVPPQPSLAHWSRAPA